MLFIQNFWPNLPDFLQWQDSDSQELRYQLSAQYHHMQHAPFAIHIKKASEFAVEFQVHT